VSQLIPSNDDPQNLTSEETERSSFVYSEHFGILPAPEDMAKYKQIDDKAFELILGYAKDEQMHRHKLDLIDKDLERSQIEGVLSSEKESKNIEKRGQLFGFLIGIFALTVGAGIVYTGQPIPGTLFGIGGVGSLVYVFIEGKKSNFNSSSP
jgi:uncharacterized membrane protein